MSAQFPNVPNVPGVPNVNRAGTQLDGMRANTVRALGASLAAREQTINGDTDGAADNLAVAVDGGNDAYVQGSSIFPPSSLVTNALSGVVGNGSVAILALQGGDTAGALVSIDETISAATTALAGLDDTITPPPLDPLASSGDDTNADTAQQWGLYTQAGDLAVTVDNVVAFSNSLEARISDYPVAPNTSTNKETVGFGSYNKVIVPYDIRLVLSRGGSVEDRQDFLKAIQDAWQSTDLFNVITPECVYLDVNVVGVRRESTNDRGVGLLSLEVALRKVRQTATLTFVDTKPPAGATQLNNGSVQATPVTPPPGTIH